MCYHVKVNKTKKELENNTRIPFLSNQKFEPKEHFNGFAHPYLPIIKTGQEAIELLQWGLKPSWAQEDFDTNNTLNARVETLEEKPSFRESFNNRCVLVVDSFYEWRHEGRNKIRYEIGHDNELLFLAALYQNDTFSVVTTEALGVMKYIHNRKQRMPIAFDSLPSCEQWLHGEDFVPFIDFSTQREDNQIRLF
ncbi:MULTISPECIES: SOS response-associated peptidase [Weeksella]|uniref:Abasic site processing protein n=1 Tax=Weeksella virosa (strain ATCC 43766 / DSM 16922 / JCM 21250 / CCUG 30538 / CDC 9751 / IAM 14551 / NBRC 16016 / NCTC 11634 / CL345/78) TaxID=865938 RepID=F0P0P5_WEEVC|nr:MULTISPECIES: SOS response-associated peptidase family protein [Weeksella]ADX68544.1 protein of unknown function DUF159 [Weeksella virosa DSM 16922]MDK7375242.1 SOS response-associated peptidase family protein [Weeksella virosa]MDK7675286.1 SOS response-associated peptidase family protein [Weeksella virosa]OFM85732.1 hypothetical protein HMPREF2660_06725 [Weeksella sp. HMSC059D05]SUP54880.1 Uncharacterised ACR, COG2135 [Weeksella virosa]